MARASAGTNLRAFRVHIDSNKVIDAAAFKGALQDILGVEQRSGLSFVSMRTSMNELQVLRLQVNTMSPKSLACIFSALPYTQAIHTLAIECGGNDIWNLGPLEISWLAYALFHPRTKTSSWKKLTVEYCDIADNAVEVLEQMGEGDKAPLRSATSLAKLMGVHQLEKKRKRGEESAAAALHIQIGDQLQLRLGRVKRGAAVYTHPSDRDSSSVVLCTVASEMELEICELTTEACRCVLVPGFGFGWVHHEELLEVNTWSVDPEHLTGLSPLTTLHVDSPISVMKLSLLLAAVGQSLSSLAVKISNSLSAVLDYIPWSCPNLTALSIYGNHRLSLDQSIRRFFLLPSTRKLRTFTTDTRVCDPDALVSILGDPVTETLQELRVFDRDIYRSKMSHFVNLLSCNTTIERFIFRNCTGVSNASLELFDGEILQSERTTQRFVAFLSVVARSTSTGADGGAESSALSRLADQNLLTIIFSFAGVCRVVVKCVSRRPFLCV